MEKEVKKVLIIPLIISGLISMVVFTIEGYFALKYRTLPIRKIVHRGGYDEYIGVGWNTIKMQYSIDGVVSNHSGSASLNTNIFLFFIVTWLIVFAISFLIYLQKEKSK